MKTITTCLLFMMLVNAYIVTKTFDTITKDIEANKNSFAVQTVTTSPYNGIKEIRVTGYIPTGNKTALGQNVIVGRTAAISPKCLDLLGSEVYIKGYGIRYINDITSDSVDKQNNLCTIDLAVPTKEHATKVGNSTSRLVRIDRK